MSGRLPHLSALRVFEAAARHLSFTRAAEELFVTQAAVSHQIKSLEQELGSALFLRRNRALTLTEEGQLLLPYVRDGFDKLLAGIRELERRRGRGSLTVSTTPSVASHWLVGRLGRFQARYPEIELRLSASPRLVDFQREDVDCGIRHGLGDWPGLRADRLFQAPMMPVVGPGLLAGDKPLRVPGDLRRHTLLHSLDALDEWRVWLRAAGLDDIDPERGITFDAGPLALQAAASGLGVALARTPIVADDLAKGILVAPFSVELPTEFAYYLVVPETLAEQPKIQAFRSWLLEEVERSADIA